MQSEEVCPGSTCGKSLTGNDADTKIVVKILVKEYLFDVLKGQGGGG
jgi:hypothetical protein